jgi:hypothetical protein
MVKHSCIIIVVKHSTINIDNPYKKDFIHAATIHIGVTTANHIKANHFIRFIDTSSLCDSRISRIRIAHEDMVQRVMRMQKSMRCFLIHIDNFLVYIIKVY